MRHALLLGLFLSSGCSSIWGTGFMPSPWVGTRFDAYQIKDADTRGKLFAALDLPFSVVLDTALLPYTIPAYLWYDAHGGYGYDEVPPSPPPKQ